MEPAVLDLWKKADPETRGLLEQAQHFTLTIEVQRVVYAMVKAEVYSDSDEELVLDALMPAPVVCLCCESHTPGDDVVLILSPSEGHIELRMGHRGLVLPNRYYFKRTPPGEMITLYAKGPKAHEEAVQRHARGFLLEVDRMLTLLAEPGIVEASTPPRAARRQAARVLGDRAPVVWSRIKWTVGRGRPGGGRSDDPKHHKALHYCRAHWRRTHEGAPRAVTRRGQPGFWTWVKGCYKGHPDFGVKLAVRVPEVDPGDAERLVAAAARGTGLQRGRAAR